MKKYQDALLANIERQLEEWFEGSEELIPSGDVGRFLHSVAGTAGSIGLTELSAVAAGLMEKLEQTPMAYWLRDDLRDFLLPVVSAGFAETNREEETEDGGAPAPKPVLDSDAPLVLVLDDDPVFLMYLKEELERSGYATLTATRLGQAVHYVHEYEPRAVVANLHLQGENGFDMLRELGDKLSSLFIPVTILSRDDTKRNRIDAFELGADDFMAKPVDMDELRARLSRQLRRKSAFDRILTRDELTGAYRRNALEEIHRHHQEDQSAGTGPFAVAMLDIEGLGRINGERGFREGDRLLSKLADQLQAQLSRSDRLVRYGGSRFVLYFRAPAGEEPSAVLASWTREFERSQPYGVAVRTGMTEVAGRETGMELALSRASEALQQAKRRAGGETGDGGIRAAAGPSGIRAAIVDDDSVVRTMLQEYVKTCFPAGVPLDVRTFRDGEQFMNDEWSRDSVPCFVILDRMMPRMDGIEVLQRLRQSAESSRYTVLMLTNKKSESDIVKALELGADDYVTKPFSLKELEARIRRLTGRMV